MLSDHKLGRSREEKNGLGINERKNTGFAKRRSGRQTMRQRERNCRQTR